MAHMHSDGGSRSGGGGATFTPAHKAFTGRSGWGGRSQTAGGAQVPPHLTSPPAWLAPRLNASVRAQTGCDASEGVKQEGVGGGSEGLWAGSPEVCDVVLQQRHQATPDGLEALLLLHRHRSHPVRPGQSHMTTQVRAQVT